MTSEERITRIIEDTTAAVAGLETTDSRPVTVARPARPTPNILDVCRQRSELEVRLPARMRPKPDDDGTEIKKGLLVEDITRVAAGVIAQGITEADLHIEMLFGALRIKSDRRTIALLREYLDKHPRA